MSDTPKQGSQKKKSSTLSDTTGRINIKDRLDTDRGPNKPDTGSKNSDTGSKVTNPKNRAKEVARRKKEIEEQYEKKIQGLNKNIHDRQKRAAKNREKEIYYKKYDAKKNNNEARKGHDKRYIEYTKKKKPQPKSKESVKRLNGEQTKSSEQKRRPKIKKGTHLSLYEQYTF